MECPAFFTKLLEGSDSPYINHFLQPDTIIPGMASPQSWNRYSYVLNNPVNASDPSGHKCVGEPEECLSGSGISRGGFTGGASGYKGVKWERYLDNGDGGDAGDLHDRHKPSKDIASTYGDGLIGPPAPSYGAYSTYFQMLPVFDPYFYAQSAEESFNDFPGGGGYETESPYVSAAASVPGVANEILLGYRPIYYANNSPYDQSVFLTYAITYLNIPQVDATRVVTLTSMQIRNGSNTNRLINYTVNITATDQSFLIQSAVSAAPGQTATVPLPRGMNGGLNVSIAAFTGCTGPCIRNPNDTTLFRGSTRFNFNP